MNLRDYKALALRRRHKYGAMRTQAADGTWFASKAEAKRYEDLLLLLRAKAIRDLKIQPRFKLEAHGEHICEFRADFEYIDADDGRRIIEDVKGVRTDVFKLKKRLMKVLLGLDVIEIVRGHPRPEKTQRRRRKQAKEIY